MVHFRKEHLNSPPMNLNNRKVVTHTHIHTHIYILHSCAQLRCSCSYAFAAVGALEGASSLSGGGLVSLSAQNIVDCSGIYIYTRNSRVMNIVIYLFFIYTHWKFYTLTCVYRMYVYIIIIYTIMQYHMVTMAAHVEILTVPISTSLTMRGLIPIMLMATSQR